LGTENHIGLLPLKTREVKTWRGKEFVHSSGLGDPRTTLPSNFVSRAQIELLIVNLCFKDTIKKGHH